MPHVKYWLAFRRLRTSRLSTAGSCADDWWCWTDADNKRGRRAMLCCLHETVSVSACSPSHTPTDRPSLHICLCVELSAARRTCQLHSNCTITITDSEHLVAAFVDWLIGVLLQWQRTDLQRYNHQQAVHRTNTIHCSLQTFARHRHLHNRRLHTLVSRLLTIWCTLQQLDDAVSPLWIVA